MTWPNRHAWRIDDDRCLLGPAGVKLCERRGYFSGVGCDISSGPQASSHAIDAPLDLPGHRVGIGGVLHPDLGRRVVVEPAESGFGDFVGPRYVPVVTYDDIAKRPKRRLFRVAGAEREAQYGKFFASVVQAA
jgi:hypothetical protein